MIVGYTLKNDGRLDLARTIGSSVDYSILSADRVKSVSIPFTYTHGHGGGIVRGVLSVALLPGNSMRERLIASVDKIDSLVSGKERYDHPVFATFIPLCTRSGAHILQSFFPLTISIFDSEREGVSKVMLGILAAIVDLATLVFRLVTFIPRAIYQRCRNTPPEGIVVHDNDRKVDWSLGEIEFERVFDYRAKTIYLG